ncbi:MAG: hypothetical protein ACP5OG_05390 [Candidatus Nanoarchaeia archaeon]
MKKTLCSIILAISSTLALTGCQEKHIHNSPIMFQTHQEKSSTNTHISQARNIINQYGDKAKTMNSENDFDGDGIKDLCIHTLKGNLYFIKSTEIQTQVSNATTLIWHKYKE